MVGLYLVLVALLSQTTIGVPVSVVGRTAAHLQPDDIAQLQRFASEAGGELWVVHAEEPEFGNSRDWFAGLYLRPESGSDGVRRGRVITVHARLEDLNAFTRPKTWELYSHGTYAQVPVAGTDMERIAEPRDLNRPFRVVNSANHDASSLSNATIARIVSVIRASRPAPPRDLTTDSRPVISQLHVEGAWPIAQIAVIDDETVAVSLPYPDLLRGQHVRLRYDGAVWRVESINMFIN
jgi:hypothetical protein